MDLFFTLIHEKSDKKKIQVNNLKNIYTTIEAKIFHLITIKLKTKNLLTN